LQRGEIDIGAKYLIGTELYSPGDVAWEEKELKGIDSSWKTYFEKCLKRHLSYLGKNNIFDRGILDQITTILAENADLLQLKSGSLLHRDFALWNILGSSDRITTLIDWDNAVIGDAADDIAIMNCFMDRAYMDHLLDAYSQTHPIDKTFNRRISFYTLRNMLWKTMIRHYMRYFDKDESFFLTKNSEGISLKEFSILKITTAIKELS